MLHLLLLIIGVFSFLCTGSANPIEYDDCFISFFEDFSGKKFVLKQIKDSSNYEQFLLVVDTAACHVAQTMQIPINRVTLIPANAPFYQKIYSDFPATIHTIASGVRTDQSNPYQNIDIHQRFRKKNSFMEEKWGVLASEETGLTLTVIQEMAKHPDLPKIVALDTFLGNADRSCPNLFYDSSTDRFCGIDMAASFNSDLAKEAYRQIQLLMDKNVLLSQKEKDALIKYTDTLKALIISYPPQTQEGLLHIFSQKAGFIEGSRLLDQSVLERIEQHKGCIKSNYDYCQKLVALLDTFL